MSVLRLRKSLVSPKTGDKSSPVLGLTVLSSVLRLRKSLVSPKTGDKSSPVLGLTSPFLSPKTEEKSCQS